MLSFKVVLVAFVSAIPLGLITYLYVHTDPHMHSPAGKGERNDGGDMHLSYLPSLGVDLPLEAKDPPQPPPWKHSTDLNSPSFSGFP